MARKALKLKWQDALDLKVRTEHRGPVVTNYQLAVYLIELLNKGDYVNRPLIMPRRPLDRPMVFDARRALVKRGLLVQDRSLPNTMLRFPDRKNTEPTELVCAVDPFGHLAYLSSMDFHGLTNRQPKVIYYLTPAPVAWKRLAEDKMRRDLGTMFELFEKQQLPELRHSKFEKIDGTVLEEIRAKELGGGWRHARDGAIRVTTLGRTFLDMLRRPDLCGGIRHVLEVFEEHAKLHLSTIITEFNQNGTKIDRVRAGYIIDERCHISDPRVEAWKADAVRGGSRKLDFEQPYAPNFSEKWCLSLNV